MKWISLSLALVSATALSNEQAEREYHACVETLNAYQYHIDIRLDREMQKCHYFGEPCNANDKDLKVRYANGLTDQAVINMQAKARGMAERCMSILDEIEG